MKIVKFVSVALFLSVLYACGSSAEKQEEVAVEESSVNVNVDKLNLENLVAEIEKREKAFKENKALNDNKGVELMEAYVAYAMRFGNRENADEYLFKAGEIAMGENLTVEAIRHLTRLYDEYPKYEKRAYGLFLLGFVQENYAKNLDEAKRIYELFLTEFPTHEMADDARASIENLGKSPEEIIREFERKDSLAKVNQNAA